MGVVIKLNTITPMVNIYDNLYYNMRRCNVINQVICATCYDVIDTKGGGALRVCVLCGVYRCIPPPASPSAVPQW